LPLVLDHFPDVWRCVAPQLLFSYNEVVGNGILIPAHVLGRYRDVSFD